METVGTPPLMEIREVARTLGWSYWRTWRLMREGRLPGVIRLGGRMYVKAAVLLDWLAGRHIEEKRERADHVTQPVPQGVSKKIMSPPSTGRHNDGGDITRRKEDE